MFNSRERVLKAINHEEPDRVPIDLGGSIVSGIMAGALVRLRHHLGMDDRKVEVYDVFQMLGRVAEDLVEQLHIDLLPIEPETMWFNHLPSRDYKPFNLHDGTEVLMPGAFEIEVSPEGDWFMHEESDSDKPVIARMPKDSYYFDKLDMLTWNREFKPPSIESLLYSNWRRPKEADVCYCQAKARILRNTTDKALVLNLDGTTGPGRVGTIPEWLVLLVTEQNYVGELMDLASEIALDNLTLYWDIFGDDIDIILLDIYDYGTQRGEMFAPNTFVKFYEPCYKAQCDWIHRNTSWKIAKHCCGSIPNLIEPMIRSGIDILNPVQTSAARMDPVWLKEKFGNRITFWGGGADTQNLLPFGTPEDVYNHVVERLHIFAPGGGFIWNPVHNIQYTVPPENIVAAFQAVHDFGHYPIQIEQRV